MALSKDEQWLIDEKYDGSTENKAMLRRDMNRLAVGEPLAYVIGWIPFLGLRIYLDSHPLIPRPETEWWVEELAAIIKERGNRLRILDLCAGSGAVGCALLKATSGPDASIRDSKSWPSGPERWLEGMHPAPEVQVAFGELMPGHEATIRKNIAENGLEASGADVRIGDLFEPFVGERFDVIACNPPYIPEGRELDASVKQYEPREALRAGSDGLDLVRRIAKEAPEYMNEGGELWLECDISNIEASKQLILSGGAKHAQIRTDPYGRPRTVVAYY